MSQIGRRQFIRISSFSVGVSCLSACQNLNAQAISASISSTNSEKLDKIIYGTDWFAQAEHGGFYQAVATGIYRDYGLDVTIKMGGAQVNGTQLLMSKAIDFFMGSATDAIKAIEAGIPKITVAAIFQKNPQVLLTHPDVGNDKLENLKQKPIYISASANTTYWPYLQSKFGFSDEQKRPYNFNVTPFLTDKQSAQQAYLTSEPLKIEKEGGFKPVLFLLADYGYNPYGCTIETRRELIENNPDLVQRFVDASIKGWYSYLDNPEPANKLIKKDNPAMTEEILAYGLEKLKEYNLITGGDAKTNGIGAMSEDRWKTFYSNLAEVGVFKKDTDYSQAFTLAFINKGIDYFI